MDVAAGNRPKRTPAVDATIPHRRVAADVGNLPQKPVRAVVADVTTAPVDATGPAVATVTATAVAIAVAVTRDAAAAVMGTTMNRRDIAAARESSNSGWRRRQPDPIFLGSSRCTTFTP